MTYSLNQLDDKLRKYLPFNGGIFIEAGANDGHRQSNTLLFEERFGWRGLLVEPNPNLIESCKSNRPNSIVEHGALVSFNYELNYIDWSQGPGLDGNADSLCAMTIHDEGNLPEQVIPHMINRGKEKIQVPAYTITHLLKKHNMTTVDLFSLDVEGYEFSVLDGLDFSYVRPRYILVECFSGLDIMGPYMKEREYNFVEQLSGHDYLFEGN